MYTFTTSDPVKAALLRMMIDAARSLNEAGDTPPEAVNREYARGQAELICDVIGLDGEVKEGLIEVITLAAPLTVIVRE